MRVTTFAIALSTALLTLAACDNDARPAVTTASSGSKDSTDTAPLVRKLTPQETVNDSESGLVGAQVRRTAHGFDVTSWWRKFSSDTRSFQAIAQSVDGFRNATYSRWTRESYYGSQPKHDHPQPPSEGLLLWELPSLVESPSEGTWAYVLGSDGATLFPFERTARSTDGGGTWTFFEFPFVEGQRAYFSGGTVLADGRLLVLLNNWSDDRANRPGRVHHGLWISEGDDWGRFTPFEPTYYPPLDAIPGSYPAIKSLDASWSVSGDVIWSVATHGRLYVSVDDGQSFTEIPAR